MNKVRYWGEVSYKGNGFHGWQRNGNLPTVQGEIERILFKIFGEKEIISVYGAGRTDTGVSAEGQVMHFEAPSKCPKKVLKALNSLLYKKDIQIKFLDIAPSSFHARFSAKQRIYEYTIVNDPNCSIEYRNKAWIVPKPINITILHRNLFLLIGTHNFKNFCSSDYQGSKYTRTIDEIFIAQNNQFINIIIVAKSFLHNQVRLMIGSCVQAAYNNLPEDYIKNLLNNTEKPLIGCPALSAPAMGLCLIKVVY